MFSEIIKIIRSKTRKEWRDLIDEFSTGLRIWMQEHGEKAAIVAFVLGIAVVALVKLFIALLILIILTGYVVWYLAPEDKN